jgi:8-oxo-dGTP diphosphatase
MKHINVRVYGILIQDSNVLVSDEYIKGNNITKFPGGGLEYGEGTKECLIREFKEELNLNIEILSHFYTTDFFVNSAFSNQSQIISVYYLVKPLGDLDFLISNNVFDFEEVKEGAQSMRWIDINKVSENDFTFIIDKHVADLLEK